RPHFDTIEMKGGGDANSAARAVIQTGEYDFAWNLQVEDEILKRMEQGGKGKADIVPGGNIEHIQLNNTDPWKEVDGERASHKTKVIVKQAAAKAGIEMELKGVVASVYFSSDVANPDTYTHFYTDIQMYTTTMTQPDPETFMNQFTSWEVSTKDNKWQGRNITRWRNEEYDKLFHAAESELDPVKRAALFIKMNDLVIQNIVVIPVVLRPAVAGISNRLK